MKEMRNWMIAATLAAVLLMGGWPSVSEAQMGYDPKLVQAAKAEGNLVIYDTTRRKVMQKLTALYTKQFGIPVVHTRKRSSGIVRMVEAERRTGKPRWDVTGAGDGSVVLRWLKEGVLTPYNPTNSKVFSKKVIKLEGFVNYMYHNTYGIGHNTKKVPSAEAPKSWKDLLHPRWKGRIAMSLPKSAGSRILMDVIIRKYGWKYFEELAKNKPLMAPSVRALGPLLLKGEADVVFPISDRDLFSEKEKGSPVDFIYPSDLVPTSGSSRALGAKAPHPNAGKLWLEFVLSKEAQTIFASKGYNTLRPDVPHIYKRPAMESLKLAKPDFVNMSKTRKKRAKKLKKIMAGTK
ncbi:MAG: extracellular solute-binding protein [Nitrospinaceae bacterium]|jgi:iron(III) transport system substrate-binding protein|nr:extracellular solute-binding protein [Nitrospinaceae bacterium]MBT3433567.1 extracellular solute-binding protein [Nitrospinaceae bacterium]MBT3819923.1 extracellular solute-binding protein [Nitrospinaceae bacterium]MBT6393351.1 extracellular solute-binding protein [Nitrospinaceae bacterium]